MDYCGATELRVLCPLPERRAQRFKLSLEIRMPRIHGSLELTLWLCRGGVGAGARASRSRTSKGVSSRLAASGIELAACTPPLHARTKLEAYWPGLVYQWLQYHTELVGIDRFRVYDLDGSFELPVQRLVAAGKVEYVPRFAHAIHPGHFGSSVESCPLCCEMLVYQDCLANFRGRARWVLNLGSPNKWVRHAALGPVAGGAFGVFMRQLRAEGWSAAYFPKVHVLPSADRRSRYAVLPGHFHRLALYNIPTEVVPAVDPACIELLSMHGVIPRPCAFDANANHGPTAGVCVEAKKISTADWYVNHYVDVLLSGRCATAGSCYSADNDGKLDLSMLQAVPLLWNWTKDYLRWLGEHHLPPLILSSG